MLCLAISSCSPEKDIKPQSNGGNLGSILNPPKVLPKINTRVVFNMVKVDDVLISKSSLPYIFELYENQSSLKLTYNQMEQLSGRIEYTGYRDSTLDWTLGDSIEYHYKWYWKHNRSNKSGIALVSYVHLGGSELLIEDMATIREVDGSEIMLWKTNPLPE